MKADLLAKGTLNYALNPKPIADPQAAKFTVHCLVWLRAQIDSAISEAKKCE